MILINRNPEIFKAAAYLLLAVFVGSGVAIPEVAASGSPAEPPELVTDRPDQTESAEVVPPGTFQLEAGWLFSRDEAEGVRMDTEEAPGALLRVGALERLELRFGWTGWVNQEVRVGGSESSASGIGDAELGAKIHFWEEKGARPKAALLVGTSVPAGDEDLTSDRFDPSFRVSLAHTLSERVSLGYNLGMSWGTENGGSGEVTSSQVEYTAALGFGLTERLGAFVEVFGELPANALGGPRNSLDGGVTLLLHDRLQLDVAAGVGLSKEAPDWFVGFGVSARWPR